MNVTIRGLFHNFIEILVDTPGVIHIAKAYEGARIFCVLASLDNQQLRLYATRKRNRILNSVYIQVICSY